MIARYIFMVTFGKMLRFFQCFILPSECRDAHVKTLTCWKFLVFFHGARFLPRHFFFFVSYDHESMCATFPKTWAMS